MNDNRISARVSDETLNILKSATALSGLKNVSSFVVNSSVENAKKIILMDKLKNLSNEQIDQLLKTL